MTDTPPPPTTPPTPPTPPYAAPVQQPMSPADEKLWATLMHVGGIVFGFLAPLIGYFVLKDRGPFVREHTVSALNWQLTLLIGYIVGYVTTLLFIGFLILPAVSIVAIIFGIIAALAANKGESYRYPFSIAFVK